MALNHKYYDIIASFPFENKLMCVSDTCVVCLFTARFNDRNLKPWAVHMNRRGQSPTKLASLGERLKCGHVYHRGCITSWFFNLEADSSDKCPMCRKSIVFSNKGGMTNYYLYRRKAMMLEALDDANQQYDSENWDIAEDEEGEYEGEEGEEGDDDGGEGEEGEDDGESGWEEYDEDNWEGEYDEEGSEYDEYERERRFYSYRYSFRRALFTTSQAIVHMTREKPSIYAYTPHPCGIIY